MRDGPYCLPSCPQTKYPDHNNICQLCHSYCDSGCSGSRNSVGDGACNSCAIGRYVNESSHEVVECLAPGSECEDGFYKIGNLRQEYGPMKGKQVMTASGLSGTECTMFNYLIAFFDFKVYSFHLSFE